MSARQNADEVYTMDGCQHSRLIQISLTDLFIHPRAIVACQFERDLILQCDVTAVKPDPQSSVQNEYPAVVSAGMDYLVVSGWAELFDAHRENRKRIFVVCVSFIDDNEVEYLALRYVYKRFTNQLDDSTEIAKENYFAMHGGTAINLFLQDMPRLSVDINQTFVSFRLVSKVCKLRLK